MAVAKVNIEGVVRHFRASNYIPAHSSPPFPIPLPRIFYSMHKREEEQARDPIDRIETSPPLRLNFRINSNGIKRKGDPVFSASFRVTTNYYLALMDQPFREIRDIVLKLNNLGQIRSYSSREISSCSRRRRGQSADAR